MWQCGSNCQKWYKQNMKNSLTCFSYIRGSTGIPGDLLKETTMDGRAETTSHSNNVTRQDMQIRKYPF